MSAAFSVRVVTGKQRCMSNRRQDGGGDNRKGVMLNGREGVGCSLGVKVVGEM